METIISILTMMVAISVASERGVQLLKNTFKFLRDNTGHETARVFLIYFSAIIWGAIFTYLSKESITPYIKFTIGIKECIVGGFLACGGSGFWHELLGIVSDYKVKVK
jgi:hypothetical protein